MDSMSIDIGRIFVLYCYHFRLIRLYCG